MQYQQTNVEQRSPEWFAERLGKATASRFGDIMAKTRTGEAAARRNYRAQLVAERLTGEREEMRTSSSMQWGVDTEATARLEYELQTGYTVLECGMFNHETLNAGASPDGLVETDGLLEIKCPNTATHIETLKRKTVPYQYFWQVIGQLWLTGREWCDFVSYDPRLPDNAQMIIIRVERDEEYIKQLEDEVTKFLAEVDEEEQFIKEYQK